MPRIRSVHPGLFTDEAFVVLTEAAQIFLIGLWTQADDQGVFEWKPATLRMRLRPTKDGDVTALLTELCAVNIIKAYEIDGHHLGAIRNFRKYQRPKFPKSVHTITADIRKYVALDRHLGGNGHDDDDPFPRNAEIAPQREEGVSKRRPYPRKGKNLESKEGLS